MPGRKRCGLFIPPVDGRFLCPALLVLCTDFLSLFIGILAGIGSLCAFPSTSLFLGFSLGVVFERAISLKYKDCAGVSYFHPGFMIRDRSFPLLMICEPFKDNGCAILAGVELGVLSTHVLGVEENSLTSP